MQIGDKVKMVNCREARENPDKIWTRFEEILDMAKKGEFKNFVFAAEMANKEVCTAWASCDLTKRQELLSHQQIDIMMGVIVENFQ